MTTLLQHFKLLTALATCVTSMALPAAADSTADLVLNMQCRGRYNIEVWQNRSSDTMLYRSTSPYGNLSLEGGSREATEGVKVYKFQNGNYGYRVWDGTLDSQEAGTLEVYENNRLIMKQACRKV